MRRHLSVASIVLIVVIAFSACNSIPDHAKLIPKDALVVAGLDTKNLTKKVAWSAITGSKLFKKWMQNTSDKKAAGDLDNTGIDFGSTLYVYAKSDTRYANGSKIVGLLPLSNAGKWESYLKNAAPNIVVKQQGNRKEAMLTQGMYAGWTDKVLIIMNLQSQGANAAQPAMDEMAMKAEMDNAFNVGSENSLMQNERFKALQHNGHDISFWMNYDQLMGQLSQGMSGKMGGLSLSNSLWKDACAAGGFDFEKGKITGDLKYYMSNDLKDIAKELGSTNADNAMVDKLPGQNLDMALAWHISPKGIKALLEKMGVLGFANIALSQQGMNTDYIFDAFTGDMAVTLNDFTLITTPNTDTAGGMNSVNYKPSMNALFVIKINKKENFNKILGMAAANGLMTMGNNTYAMPISETDSVIIITNDTYAVVANKMVNARAYLDGTNHQGLSGEAASIKAHPAGMYVNLQEMLKSLPASLAHTTHDSAVMIQCQKLLQDASMSGGSFKDGAMDYHMSMNFTDKNENSLLQLMNFAMMVNDNGSIQMPVQ